MFYFCFYLIYIRFPLFIWTAVLSSRPGPSMNDHEAPSLQKKKSQSAPLLPGWRCQEYNSTLLCTSWKVMTLPFTCRHRDFTHSLGKFQDPRMWILTEAGHSWEALLPKHPAVSGLQSSKILENPLSLAADTVRHLRPDTPPAASLFLDSAYGTDQDSGEFYAKFMELLQDAREKPSTYLQNLQGALSVAVKRGGVPTAELDQHLLNQLCCSC